MARIIARQILTQSAVHADSCESRATDEDDTTWFCTLVKGHEEWGYPHVAHYGGNIPEYPEDEGPIVPDVAGIIWTEEQQ